MRSGKAVMERFLAGSPHGIRQLFRVRVVSFIYREFDRHFDLSRVSGKQQHFSKPHISFLSGDGRQKALPPISRDKVFPIRNLERSI
jgi:hypothetical protein